MVGKPGVRRVSITWRRRSIGSLLLPMSLLRGVALLMWIGLLAGIGTLRRRVSTVVWRRDRRIAHDGSPKGVWQSIISRDVKVK